MDGRDSALDKALVFIAYAHASDDCGCFTCFGSLVQVGQVTLDERLVCSATESLNRSAFGLLGFGLWCLCSGFEFRQQSKCATRASSWSGLSRCYGFRWLTHNHRNRGALLFLLVEWGQKSLSPSDVLGIDDSFNVALIWEALLPFFAECNGKV